MTSFYALEPHAFASDRYFKIYVTDRDLRGVLLGGQIYDEDAAFRISLSAPVLAPLIKLWTDRSLRNVRRRELEYDGMDLSTDGFLAQGRRNFRIAKAEIADASLDRKKRRWGGRGEIAGTLRLRLQDRTAREWIIVGDQDVDAIAASLGFASLRVAPLAPPAIPPADDSRANLPAEAGNPARDDLLAELLAAPPPRKVSPALLRAARRQDPSFGVIRVGLVYCALGVGLVALPLHGGAYDAWALNRGWTAHATGRVATVSKFDRPDRDGGMIYSYDFTFSPAGGAERHGTSFTTGQRWSAGASVDIDYLPALPGVARIAGSRTARANIVNRQLVGFLLAPLSSLALLALGLWGRRRVRLLLQNGTVGEALVQSVKPLQRRVRGQKVHRITLVRCGAGDQPIVIQKYQPEAVAFYQARLASRQPVYMIFDSAKPKRSIFPETLA
jgi:hypothetical protein